MTNTNIANNYQAAIKAVKNTVWPEAKPFQVRNVLSNRQIGLRDFMYDPEGFSIKFESELLAAKQELEDGMKLNGYIA
jgi:hypothetical protein